MSVIKCYFKRFCYFLRIFFILSFFIFYPLHEFSVRKMNHQPPPNLHPHHIQPQQQQQQQQHQHLPEQLHHKPPPPYIVHPAHLYNNQKTVEVVPSLPQQPAEMAFLHQHPASSQAIYVNTITSYHGSPSQQQHPQQQARSTASNVIYVNTATVVPSAAGQHSHFGPGQPPQPLRHPGSAGHVPYSPAIHPGFHHHPPQQPLPHQNLSDPSRHQLLPENQHQPQLPPPLNRPTHLFNNSSPQQKLRIGTKKSLPFIFSLHFFCCHC